MGFFTNLFKISMVPDFSETNISEVYNVPEPTKSLLYVTNEDTSKIKSPFSLQITFILTNSGVKKEEDDGKNMYGEPSLIWTKLPVRKNTFLEDKPLYYPAYSSLNPDQRYQYLMWLKDVTQPTNLSYVFLYYYGLERQLLLDNFEKAFDEIVRLLKHHDKGSFRSYAETALIVSAIHKNRLDLIQKNTFLYDGVSNEELILRKQLGVDLTARDVMKLASDVGFKNKRYIKLCPEEFERELEQIIVNYEYNNEQILDSISIDDMKKEPTSAFANHSLKEKIRMVNIPDILTNEKFKSICLSLLEKAHHKLKEKRKR